jgi:hypothetical protein
MIATTSRISAALLVAAAFTASANAEYRCDPAPTAIDRAACQAAAKSPEALRRYVELMNFLRLNLQFSDYVDAKTAQRWDTQRGQMAEQKNAIEDAQKVASNSQR